MENYSLSDIASVSGGGSGFGGGNSAWVLIILFALIFGWGGNGFGGGNNGAITEAQMCNMNNFTQLENSVGRLGDQLNQNNNTLMQAASQIGYQNLEQSNQIARDMCTGFAQAVAATNAVGAQAQQCCCEVSKEVMQNRYEGAMNTAAINANIDAKFAAIEKAQLEAQIAAQQNQINQLSLQTQLCGVVRYPNATTYSAGYNPFYSSGCNCGCGNV